MKRLLHFCLLMLLAGSVQGQYFQHAYGNTFGNEVLTDGTPTITGVGMLGHLFTGTTDLFASTDMALGRLDNQGNIAGPDGFFETYRHFDLNGNMLLSKPVEVLHTIHKDIITVGVLSYPGQADEYTYVSRFAGNGVIISTIGFHSATWKNATPTAAVISAYNPDVVYVTGYVRYAPSATQTGTHVFLLEYDFINNILLNSMVYDLIPGKVYDNIPAGIICSPPQYAPEVIIVGNHIDANAGVYEGFFMNVKAPNLNWAGVLTFYDNKKLDFITGITSATSFSGGSDGYMICGNNDALIAGDLAPWVFKVDPVGNLLFTNNLPYNLMHNTEIYDIVERKNWSGKYEYFATGYTKLGFVGNDVDLVVYKIDDNCLGIGEFTYGNWGDQIGIALGLVEGTNEDGLGVYGRENGGFISGGLPEFYALKTYFDGNNNCGEKLNPAQNWTPPTWQYWDQVSQPDIIKDFPLRLDYLRKLGQFFWCNTPFIPWASNARTSAAPTAISGEAFVAPNPVALGSEVMLNTDYAKEQSVHLSLLNMEGKVLDTQVLSVGAGKQQTSLSFEHELAAGMYLLQVRAGEQLDVLRLVVE